MRNGERDPHTNSNIVKFESYKPGREVESKRSSKLVRSVQTAAVLGAIAVSGYFGAKYLPREFEDNNHQTLIGREVDNKPAREFITDGYGAIDEIPLRASPKLSDENIVGWTKPGSEFLAKEEYGVTYPSFYGLGDVKVNGDSYGLWYKGEGLPLYQIDGSGNLVPQLDKNGLQLKSKEIYVAGNFLKAIETSK